MPAVYAIIIEAYGMQVHCTSLLKSCLKQYCEHYYSSKRTIIVRHRFIQILIISRQSVLLSVKNAKF